MAGLPRLNSFKKTLVINKLVPERAQQGNTKESPLLFYIGDLYSAFNILIQIQTNPNIILLFFSVLLY